MKGFVLFITDDIINPDNINIREQISDIFDDPNNLGEINFLKIYGSHVISYTLVIILMRSI
jgi:hypothetical protein